MDETGKRGSDEPSIPRHRPQPIVDRARLRTTLRRPRRRRIIRWVIAVALVVVVTAFALLSSRPVDRADTTLRTVEIVSGTSPDQIGTLLEEAGVIRSDIVFSVYVRARLVQGKLQAGIYRLSPSMSLSEVVDNLVRGPAADEIEITFIPGATLAESRQVLIEAGYSEAAIDAAFAARYDHPLFAGRPDDADLEGYLFGETRRFVRGTPLDQVLGRFFDDYYEVVEDNDLVAAYAARGLSLYEGITLASIIQRESGGDDKSQIAQVFFLRIEIGMPLGSDVTYQYIADKLGIPRSVNLDNPYNTRRYGGLPPGPIATPGVESLLAVGAPADGDYLYFLSGDDGVTRFARTVEEHEANKSQYCQQKCQIL